MKKLQIRTLIIALLTLPIVGFSLMNTSPEFQEKINALPIEFPADSTQSETYPAIMVKDQDGKSLPIRMKDLKIEVDVLGNIATTTMYMNFQNDSNQVLEGELYFPLGAGQTVSRFAMDVEGNLREGVIVEKNKGQEVFESVIRQKIDPGLLEWTKGNNFKARVYPLEPKKTKRIVIAYEQELGLYQNCYVYTMPLNFKQKVDQFTFNLEAYNQEIKPQVKEHNLGDFVFEMGNDNYYSTSVSKSNYIPNESISIALPVPEGKQRIFTEKIPGSNSYFYYTSFQPEKVHATRAFRPKTISLIWDASTSSNDRNLDKEFELIQDYLTWNKNASIQLYILRNNLEAIKNTEVRPGDWQSLISVLKSIKNDGASAYEQIDYSSLGGDAIFLFGDGLSNFGERTMKLPEVPICTVNSSPSANHSYLRFLAASTGGEYVNLMTSSSELGVELLQCNTYKYFGSDNSQTYPSIPTSMTDEIHVAGIINGAETITFEFGTEGNTSKQSITIDPEKHLTESGLLGRIWAQKKLAELDINFKENSDEITALGKQFQIVTRNTSLIVLDRVEDYVEHEITPPEELQKEYFAQLDKQKKDEKKELEDHLAKIRSDFRAYVDWWNTDYDLNKIIEKDRKKAEEANEEINLQDEETIQRGGSINVSESIEGTFTLQHEQADGFAYSSDIQAAPSASANFNVVASPEFKTTGTNGATATISMNTWTPDAPYIEPLKKASNDQLYETYLNLKEEHQSTPSFFLDASDEFLARDMPELALRVLSNIAEFELENHELMRVLAHRLEQLAYYKLAIPLYQEVLKIRKEEPQSYRDLGLCLAKDGQYQNAITVLYKSIQKPWDTRFPGIETIVLAEMNQIIALHHDKVRTSHIDPEFLKEMPTDVRVVLNWDADNCDMDLWVTDPRGEKCFYQNKSTAIGARMSNDFTGGYGPEVFELKKAMKGDYKVQVNYYGTRSQRISGPTTIQVQIITNYGKPNQKVQEVTRRLSESKEILDIGEFVVLKND